MNFLKPAYLYLLLLIPLLLLLYVLKLRRKTYVVSSCLLWEQAVEDMKANTLFQRLRRNLLLPLQIVFLMLAILALARPFWRGTDGAAQNTILIIDGSASMKATDIEETRFEAAKSAASKMVDGLSDGDRMMIIEATSSSKIVSGFTSDKSQLRDALNKMKPTDTATDLGSAIQLASSIAKDMQKSKILLLSDGAGIQQDTHIEEFEHINMQMRFVVFGKKDADNVGITALEVGQKNPSECQVFIALQNFSDIEKRSLLLELYHNENLIDVRELSLLPKERRSIVFDNIRYAEGSIKAVIDVDDDLDVDNYAYYVMSESSAIKILLVSPGNLFLEEAIKTASARIRLIREKPEAYSINKENDMVVFDSFIPKDFPNKNMILVNPRVDLPFGKLISHNDSPKIIDWDRTHPVMRFVDLSNLQVGGSDNYEMPLWMKPLAESDMGTLAWLGENDGRRLIVLPFEIQPSPFSNFPMLTAFPIFMSNALNWLAGTDPDSSNRQVKAGKPLKLSLPNTAVGQVITVKKPNGEEEKLRLKSRDVVFTDTDRVGIYEVISEGVAEKFAVNLLDEAESNIKPTGKIEIAGHEIASSTVSTVSKREIWASLVLVALMLLAAEWWVYHRRVLV